MEKIVLNAYQLIVDSNYADRDFFSKLSKYLESNDGNGSFQNLNQEIIAFTKILQDFADDYFFISFKMGSSIDYSSVVIDTDDGNREKENPKKKSEIEPIENIYLLYSFKSSELFLSSRSKSSLENLLQYFFKEQKFVVKKVIKKFEDFISKLNEMLEIRVALQPDNIFVNADHTKVFGDIFGIDNPNSFELAAIFEKNYKPVKKYLLKLKERFDNHEFSKLIIVGQDADGIERRFNTDRFFEKVEMEVLEDETNIEKARRVLQFLRVRLDL